MKSVASSLRGPDNRPTGDGQRIEQLQLRKERQQLKDEKAQLALEVQKQVDSQIQHRESVVRTHVLGGTRRHQKYFLSILALMFAGICRAGEAPAMPGAELYREFCASCHGVKGHGNGPVASSLRQKVPDLTLIAKRRGGSFPAEEIHRIVDGRLIPRAHGSAEMPVWGWEQIESNTVGVFIQWRTGQKHALL